MTSYGKNLKLTVFGTSHGDEIGMRLDGVPSGEQISYDELLAFCERRAPGKNAYSTSRKEADKPLILSGFDKDLVSDGREICAVIKNTNAHPSDYSSVNDIPRPSHADFAAVMKYGNGVDLRGGGQFSGRLTAPLCIAGGICKQILERKGIYIGAHVSSVGNIHDLRFDSVNLEKDDLLSITSKDFPVISDERGNEMKALIEKARSSGDSVGGTVECAAIGIRAGLGEHMFDGVESRIASIVFGIPAVKGIEFGSGFYGSSLFGSENNDPFVTDGASVRTKTNNAGGILGGMTTGMPVVFRCALKPTPSIATEQDSVSLSHMENVKIKINGRHDPCIAVRAVPVFEAACAIAVLDMMLDT